MCVTICGRFCPDEGVVAGYDNRIRVKYTAKWGVQIAGMIFQTRSRACLIMVSRGNKLLFLLPFLLPSFSGKLWSAYSGLRLDWTYSPFR
ncbi:DUF6783 domain-containing protein [Ruminococcus sp. AM42-11]|uniref:DUF6783 domain-containing protein n=1 Tax=Ruminococcus sp. AM42-11 TaxID=2292372 RepID=UPI00325B433E